MSKVNRICKKTSVGDAIQFAFSNGKTLVADFHMIPEAIQIQLAMHGMSQKIGDSYASATTVQQAIENATETYNNLVNGEWSTKREGGQSVTIEAVSRHLGITVENAQAAWAKFTPEQQKAVAAHPDVKELVATIKLERIQAQPKPIGGEGTLDLGALFTKASEPADVE